MGEFMLAEGYRPSLPVVEVEAAVLERYNTVRVDYEGLEEMYHGDLAVPRSFTPCLQLRDEEVLGAHGPGNYNPFTHVMMANPRLAREKFGEDGLPIVILHEGRHMADGVSHPARMKGGYMASRLALLAAGYGGYKAGAEVLNPHDVVATLTAVTAGAMSVNVAAKLMHLCAPAELRARATHRNQELLEKYRTVIECA